MLHHIMMNVMLKGQKSNEIFMPSDIHIKNIEYALDTHPFLGSGFDLPVHRVGEHLKYFNVDAGNLIFGVIIFSGIIGLTIYLLYFVLLTIYPFKISFILFMITIFINMDQVVMFNSLNIGVICYIFWGIYLKDGMSR